MSPSSVDSIALRRLVWGAICSNTINDFNIFTFSQITVIIRHFATFKGDNQNTASINGVSTKVQFDDKNEKRKRKYYLIYQRFK